MNTPLESSIRTERPSSVGVVVVLLLLALILAGCESPSGTPGNRPGGGAAGRPGATSVPGQGAKPFASAESRGATPKNPLLAQPTATSSPAGANPLDATGKPVKNAENKAAETTPEPVNPLAPMAKVEQAGNTVELASSIIAAKANPFLDWLPKPLQVETMPTSIDAAVPVAIPADPFANVSLLGVIVHPKTPMVLLGGGEQTQLLGQGGVLNLEVSQAKVIAIRANSVDLRLLDGSNQTRTLELPDIIGYQPVGGKTNASEASSKGSGSVSAAGSSVPAGSQANGSPVALNGLGNLQKLTQPVLPPAALAKGAQPNLQEP